MADDGPALARRMHRYRETAAAGDPAACREAMAGTTRQEGAFRTEGRFGAHRVYVDEPGSFGGGDSAANPAELLFAALGASVAVTLRCHAALMGIAVGAIEVAVAGDLDIRGFFDSDPAVRAGFKEIALSVRMESAAAPAERAALLAAVQRGCPLLDALRDPTPVTLELAP